MVTVLSLAQNLASFQPPAGGNVKPLCGLAKAVAPATNTIAGQILGLASMAQPLIIIILVGLLLLAATKLRGPLMIAALTILGIGMFLTVAPNVLHVLMPSSC